MQTFNTKVMPKNSPSLDLMEFIETQILPQYASFDKAHNLEHVTRVIRRSMDAEQIKMMKEAIEDHRASASHSPRSLYGKIVAEADRDIVPEQVFRRTVQYGLSHYPQLDREHHWQRFRQHMDEKYSSHGYIRLWIPGSPNEQKLNELRNIIANPTALRQQFERYFDEETAQKDD